MCGCRESNWYGSWPGRGPYSHLPPWERPGRSYEPGACWRYHAPRSFVKEPMPTEETEYLKSYLKELEQELQSVEARIKQLKEVKGEVGLTYQGNNVQKNEKRM